MKTLARLSPIIVLSLFLLPAEADGAGPFRFYSVTPCRIVDTRRAPGPTGGPRLAAGSTRSFPVTGYCGVPSTARAAVLNLTVVTPGGPGHLVVWPYNTPQPLTSAINFSATDSALANGAVIPLTQPGSFQISVVSAAATDLIIDITGYYAP